MVIKISDLEITWNCFHPSSLMTKHKIGNAIHLQAGAYRSLLYLKKKISNHLTCHLYSLCFSSKLCDDNRVHCNPHDVPGCVYTEYLWHTLCIIVHISISCFHIMHGNTTYYEPIHLYEHILYWYKCFLMAMHFHSLDNNVCIPSLLSPLISRNCNVISLPGSSYSSSLLIWILKD